MLRDKNILITGDAWSFGNAFVPMVLDKFNPKKNVVSSRDGVNQLEMISAENALCTYGCSEYFKILPMMNNWSADSARVKDGEKVPDGFVYAGDNNSEWMSLSERQVWIDTNREKIGLI